MNIGFDLDGVIYDWHLAVFSFLKSELELPVESVEKIFDVSDSEIFWDNIISLPFLYNKFSPRDAEVEFINKLSKEHTIFYITYRPKHVFLTTYKWLKTYKYPDVDNLIFSENKSIDIRINDISLFLEDRPYIVEQIKNVTNCILMNRFYNYDYEYDKRINNIFEMEKFI